MNQLLKVMKVSDVNSSIMARNDIDYNSKIPLLWRTRNYENRKFGYVAYNRHGSFFARTKKEAIKKAIQ